MTTKAWRRRIDEAAVVEAIRRAEGRTSGEIRVSVAPFFLGSVEAAAARAFRRLEMDRTRLRNGVLVFVVPTRRRFAVLGDEGIHAKVGQAFWEEAARSLSAHFREGRFTEGLTACVDLIGERLAEHFPRSSDDRNELPDAVDRG